MDDIQYYSDETVRKSTPYEQLVETLEEAFQAYANETVEMPAKTYIDIPKYNGDFRAMPAYVETPVWEASGVKWVNVHPDNPDTHNMPTVMAMVILSDPSTGEPIAVLEGTELTKRRTGAVAALATDKLARNDASSLGLVGAGTQAHAQLNAIASVRDISEVVVADADKQQAEEFQEAVEPDYDVKIGTIEDAVACDVVSTTTPVEDPIIPVDAVESGTHINAMGADARGKQEFEPEIFDKVDVAVYDDWSQAHHSGEINVPYNELNLEKDDLAGSLADAVVGVNRTSSDEITMFDSTGLAIQDIATAYLTHSVQS